MQPEPCVDLKRVLMQLGRMSTLARTTEDIIGTFRTFGDKGPVYEVTAKANGQSVHVVVVETGEEFDYSAERAIQDPEAE